LSLHQQDGMALGEIDDDRVVVTAGRGEGLTFRQIELELGCADVSIVKKSLKRLRAAGAHPEGQQKLGKALGASGVAVPRPKVGRHAEVGAAVQHSLTDGCTRLLDQDYRLRREPSDPPVHAVHKARVACRRLRSDLQTFGPLLDPLWLQHVVADLRWLGVVLGHLRDSDVLSLRLTLNGDAAAMETGGLEELRGHLAQERRRSSRDLAEAMDSERYLRLVERLRTAAHAPPFSLAGNMDPGDPARVALPSLLLPRSKALRRRVRRAGHHPSDHDLHRIRIAAKRLRYGAEAASPVLGKPARRVARQAERLQVVLGEHHDAVAAEAWLRRVVRAGTGSAAFAAGLLVTSEQERQRHLRRRWERRWEAVYTSTQWLH
jgi:CHAD domain-containing protein